MGNSANVKAKSNQVVAGIESLLVELGAGTSSAKMKTGIVSLEEAPASAPGEEHVAPVEEPANAEEPVEEDAPAEIATPVEEATPAVESEAEEEPASAPKEAEEDDDGGDEEEDEDDE